MISNIDILFLFSVYSSNNIFFSVSAISSLSIDLNEISLLDFLFEISFEFFCFAKEIDDEGDGIGSKFDSNSFIFFLFSSSNFFSRSNNCLYSINFSQLFLIKFLSEIFSIFSLSEIFSISFNKSLDIILPIKCGKNFKSNFSLKYLYKPNAGRFLIKKLSVFSIVSLKSNKSKHKI